MDPEKRPVGEMDPVTKHTRIQKISDLQYFLR